MAGGVARTICHVDEKAMDIEHAKKVSQQVSKVRESSGFLAGLGMLVDCDVAGMNKGLSSGH